jgi:hypothetical protein
MLAHLCDDDAHPRSLRLAGARYQPALFAQGSLRHGYVAMADRLVLLYLHTL